MGEIFKLFGTIGVNNKEANSALSETEAKGRSTATKLDGFFKNLSSKIGQTFSGLGKKIDLSGASAKFTEWGGKINSALVKGVKTGAKVLAVSGTAAMAAAGATLVKGMNLAGELEQNMGGSVAVFGKYAGQLQKTGVNAYRQMGLSQSDFLAGANKMGSLYQGVGFSVKDSMSMSSDAMQRAADVASIMGVDIGSAMESVGGMAKGNFEMMDNLGVAMNDTTIGNYALSKGITKSTAKMSTQEKVGLATQMFMEKTAKYAGNYAKENDTLAGSLQTAKSAMSNFMSGAGNIDDVITAGLNFAKVAGKTARELAPKLMTGILQAVKEVVPKIPSMLESLAEGLASALGQVFGKGVQEKFEGLTNIIKKALSSLKSAFDFFVKYKDIFMPIAVGIASVVGFLSAWNAATKIATAVQGAFNVVLNANPFAIVVLAIAALVSALVYFFTQTKTGQQIWKDFTDFLINAWTVVKDKAAEIWNALGEFFTGIWQGIKDNASAAWEGFSAWISGIWQGVVDVAQGIWQGLVDVFSFIWVAIKEVFSLYWTLISTPLIVAWNAIVAVAQAIWQPLVQFFTVVWDGIKQVFTTTVNGIAAFLSPIWNAISGTIKTVFNAIKNFFSAVWSGIKSVITTAVNAIKTVITTVFNTVKGVVTTIFSAVKTVITNVWNGIKTVVTNVVNAIKTVVSNVFTAVRDKVSEIWNGIKNTTQELWEGIKTTISNVVNGIKSTVSNIFESLKSTVSSVWNGIKNAISTPINAARDAVKAAIDKIKGFFNVKLRFPHIDMPHFSISGSFSLKPPSVPHIGVDWYAKGGIMQKAMAFGMNGDNLMVGGEAGKEAILPLDRDNLAGIGAGIAKEMGYGDAAVVSKLDELINVLTDLFAGLQDLQVVMDSGALVGSIKDKINEVLGRDQIYRGRGR